MNHALFSQHCDLATLSGISKFSGGQVSWIITHPIIPPDQKQAGSPYHTSHLSSNYNSLDPGPNFPRIPQPSQPPSSREIWTGAQKISYEKGQQSHHKHSNFVKLLIIISIPRLDLKLWWEYVAHEECHFTLSMVNTSKGSASEKTWQYCLTFSIRIFQWDNILIWIYFSRGWPQNLFTSNHCRSLLCEVDRLVELTKCQPWFCLWHAGTAKGNRRCIQFTKYSTVVWISYFFGFMQNMYLYLSRFR